MIVICMKKSSFANKTMELVAESLLERFGEPIGQAPAVAGAPDERDVDHMYEMDDELEEAFSLVDRGYEECKYCGEGFHGEGDEASEERNVCKFCAAEGE